MVTQHPVTQNHDEFRTLCGKNAAYRDWLNKLSSTDQLPRGRFFKGKKAGRPIIIFDEAWKFMKPVLRTTEFRGIQILNYEEDRELHCVYQGCVFNLQRDPEDAFSFGNWYMIVKDEDGETLCDGWIDDSSSLTVRRAFEAACTSAELELPAQWPDLN